MRLKSELYKKEQDYITDKIISILDLDNKNTYTLYELDNNKESKKRNIKRKVIIWLFKRFLKQFLKCVSMNISLQLLLVFLSATLKLHFRHQQ